MSSDLYRRLRQRVSGRSPAAGPPDGKPMGEPMGEPARPVSGARSSSDRSPPDGWHERAPLVYIRETLEQIARPPGLSPDGTIESCMLGRTVPVSALRFMDTETTGLSGGAGTTVFLVGSGELTAEGIRVRQVLLGDFPGEPGFLEQVSNDLADPVWVSYNGKAFDGRLLESRFLMNGMSPLNPEHVDLLTWSRRLWRSRIGPCALSDLERSILGRERHGDIPGIEIPDRYFAYLRTGRVADLEPVFEHHRLDIVSLVYLFLRIESVLREPAGDPTIDRFQLGRWLLATREDTALSLLEDATTGSDSERVRAALLLARTYRRRGRPLDALRILERVADAGSVCVVVEAAKIHEHDLRDPSTARALVGACLDRPNASGIAPELRHRLDRLCRKSMRRSRPA